MGIERARGEIRYQSHHRAYALGMTVANGLSFDDGRVRVSISHSSDRCTVHVQAHAEVEIESFALYYEQSFDRGTRFFLNGYQSWTDSREFSPGERITPFPPFVRPVLERFFRTNHYGDYDFLPTSGAHLHGFTYFYLRSETGGTIDFCGSLSEGEGYTIFRVLSDERRVIVQKDAEGLALASGETWKAFDLHVESGDEEAVFVNYLRRCHEVAGLSPRSSPPWTGWTSWYYHYTNISEKIILQNLDAFTQRNIPIDVFQIDDGWQAAVGDWLDVNAKFPHGLRPLVDRIHEAGYRAGLWLAPLVAERKSRLVAEHPEWLLRDAQGTPVPAGNSNLWSGDFYGLDVYHDGLRAYLKNVFDVVLGAWGMDLVKLDFLYGACLMPGHGKTRGRKMVDTMELLRSLVGDKVILGCGVPIGPAIGRVEVCRIGPDVGHEWANTLTRGLGMRETVSTVTALENAIGRRHLSGRAFSNDPDVFFLRRLSFDGAGFDPFLVLQELRWGKRVPLSDHEKYTLFLLNNLFGRLVFISDDIDEYTDEMMALYLSSFPLVDKPDVRVTLVGPPPAFGEIGGGYEIRFHLGSLHYLVYANLADETFTTALRKAAFSRDTQGRGRFHALGETVTLEPHASICLLEESSEEIALVGAESHLFPGADVEVWSPDRPDGLTIRRHARARGTGSLALKVPFGKTGLRINGTFVPAKEWCGRPNLVVIRAADI